MAPASYSPPDTLNNPKPNKEIPKNQNLERTRMNSKKQPTASPSSYTFAPRWMSKNGNVSSTSSSVTSRPGSPSEENFPSLPNSGEESKKKRSVWNDPNAVKRKVISPVLAGNGNEDDPFAGMNTLIDYQQEIERLKALVPKVEKKRTSARPKSTGADLKGTQRSSSAWNDSGSRTGNRSASGKASVRRSMASPPPKSSRPMSTVSLPSTTTTTTTTTKVHTNSDYATTTSSSSSQSSLSVSSENTTTGGVSRASSVASEDGKSDAGDYCDVINPPVASATEKTSAERLGDTQKATTVQVEEKSKTPTPSVITEEEKARFLEFMRSWTGGWQGWYKNDKGSSDIKKTGSLWTEESSWQSKRSSWQDRSAVRCPDPLTVSVPHSIYMVQSEPTTPVKTESYWTLTSPNNAGLSLVTPNNDKTFSSAPLRGPIMNEEQYQRQLHRPMPYYRNDFFQRSHITQLQHKLPNDIGRYRNNDDLLQFSSAQQAGTIGERHRSGTLASRGVMPRMNTGNGAPFGVFVM